MDRASRRNNFMSGEGDTTLVDGHVHVHDCNAAGALLDAARRNFRVAARDRGLIWPCGMAILLTESAGKDCFGFLAGLASRGDSESLLQDGRWRLRRTRESSSLTAIGESGERIAVIAGSQVVTREGLEVLVLGTESRLPDGQPIEETLETAQQAEAITVLPWGFGKWLGRRGQIVRRIILGPEGKGMLVGDNSGRLRYLPPPSEFRLAAQRNIRVLPGTDPLPIGSEFRRVGSFGASIEGTLSADTPTADLRRWLIEERRELRPYGRAEGLGRFIRNQALMQVAKRRRSG